MHYLFNSRGRYIALWVGNQLYTPSGKHIGHYLRSKAIFVDHSGHYLGEVVRGNRLMLKRSSPFRGVDFGRQQKLKQIGQQGQPDHLGYVEVPHIYEDVPERNLRRTAPPEESEGVEAQGEQLTGRSRQ